MIESCLYGMAPITEKAEGCNQTENDIIKTVIFNPKRIQKQTDGIKSDEHQKYHAYIKNQRVFYNALLVDIVLIRYYLSFSFSPTLVS